ncbi:MAG: serine--tRNA ligase, partial [Bacteroidetes bacterium SW_10_40_5]
SYDTLEGMVGYGEQLVQKLELPYRVMKLCGGDLGAAATLTYDIEVYAPAQDKWLEVSSISNFEDYQANRLKLRFKDGSKQTRLAHTLNGSALAFPRLLAAMLENYQSDDGTAINIPEALAKYTGFEEIKS